MSSVEPPPILTDLEDELKKYMLCPENLPIHQYERNQEFWPRKPNPLELLDFDGCPLATTLKVQRDPDTGQIIGFREVPIEAAGATGKNSMSLNRAPALPTDSVKGSASYIPFWPGSFPEPTPESVKIDIEDSELLTVPPGFDRGLVFADDGQTLLKDGEISKKQLSQSKNVINLLDVIKQEQDMLGVFDNKQTEDKNPTETLKETQSLPEEDEIIPKDVSVLKLSSLPPPHALKGTEWAVLLDTTKPVKNFKELLPEMALEFEFELDTFQKLAILQLEKHNHVFVAAHTSAGKTVVAEYAIALSQKHMTRTIYTSPIKALSNQKYRDFKKKFNDVGLITGDFQINQTATCLIMTTEILRTMLYCGSDIARDLEYVIFDEVHYINDRERGHVWEQVLILLPAHVCIVLLSATVPNTIEFADWLARTRQRKVYIVSTQKRPVPLQHFLYTGRGGSTRDNRFLILDADEWRMGGYIKAKESLDPDQNKKPPTGKDVNRPDPKRTSNFKGFSQSSALNFSQEKTLWYGLVAHLKKHNLLPVVAFTFSRKKCDDNATNLTNLDLTSQEEKHHIDWFFRVCIKCLKEPDRIIPQVLNMRDILCRGIGVHHSGILPIIKEIVEMLFQQGFIKLLFATETFAMGVNMPARTVVFDSVRKHDGVEIRNLQSAEYIQMAGRAGRRGLDEQGTVIILCKQNVPPIEGLKQMMTGRPSSLESQFRLTYGMVLSLLRVESLSVEGMMSRSFREADHQKSLDTLKANREEINKKLEDLCQQQLSSYLQPLVKFYDSASVYLTVRSSIMPIVLASPKLQKVLTPGRIMLVTLKNHVNKLGLLLCQARTKNLSYKVLVLTDPQEKTEDKDDLWYKMLGLAQDKLFLPLGAPGHDIITVSALDVFEISAKTIKVNTDVIIQDWEKRQMERFKHDPAGQTCIHAVQELQKLTILANDNSRTSNKLEYYHFIIDLKVNEQKMYESLDTLYGLKDKLIDHLPSTQIPNFEDQFQRVFERKFLEEKLRALDFKLSNASLSLYPDYENRIELLRVLKYVDMQNRVQLKGRVACEMGMNELLITELVLRGTLTRLKPEEVAALLSALVFRVRSRGEDGYDEEELSSELKNGIKEIQEIHKDIASLELSLRIQTEEFQENLNFGLVNVVYKWAQKELFAKIMELTTVQEGIIVRCIQQLNETICDVRDAARIIGDPELQNKMEEASAAIKRDIVFAASLYTLKLGSEE